MVWQLIFLPHQGVLAGLFHSLGLSHTSLPTLRWTASRNLAPVSIIIFTVWKTTGLYMVIFLAGLKSIPMELIEAARVDGAREWRLIRHVILPLLSTVATLIIIASFLMPMLASTETLEHDNTSYALLFLMYLVLAFVTIFFNAALVHAAHERLRGGDPTVGSALRGALARLGRILPWALVSATVSFVLRGLEQRAGLLGQIAAGLAGMAWSLVTFLVLPVLVIEDIGVTQAIRRSGAW